MSYQEELVKKIDESHVTNLYYILFLYNFLHGIILGNFSGLLSSIKSKFDLSTGQMGDALSTASIGAVIGLLFIPRLLVEQGSRVSAIYASIFFLFTYTMLTIATATNVYFGLFALICMGLGIVWMDSSLNTQAALMETMKGFPLFGRLQGTYSIGAIVGALISARLVDDGFEVWEILSLATLLYFPAIFTVVYFLFDHEEELIVNQVREKEKERLEALRQQRRATSGRSRRNETADPNAAPMFPEDSESESEDEEGDEVDANAEERRSMLPHSPPPETQYGTVHNSNEPESHHAYAQFLSFLFSKPIKPHTDFRTLFILSLIILVINFAESAVTYFSEMYLELWNVSETTAVMGFVAFQMGLATSRLLSDWIVFRVGRKHVMIIGNAVAGIGMGLVAVAGITLTTTTLVLAIIGFVTVGLFEGPLMPVLLGFASNLKGFQPGDAIPIVTAFGMMGLVIGPLVNGNIVDWFSYKSTFFIQALLMVIAAMMALLTKERYLLKRVKQRASPPPSESPLASDPVSLT